MLHVYEFEIFEDEGWMLAFPYDMDGGTQGKDFGEACEMAAGWLKDEMDHRAMHDLPFPDATFGNEPAHEGGKTVIVAVDSDKAAIPRMTAAAAADMLGVTPGRVSQMMAAGKLETFEDDGRIWVTRASVEARKAMAPKAGRPKKKAAMA